MPALPTPTPTPSPPSSPATSAASSLSNRAAATTPRLLERPSPFPCKRERLSIMAHIKPYHRAHMRARLEQIPARDASALSADPEVLLELWRMRVDGEISLEGDFTPEEELKAFERVHRVGIEGGAIGGPLVAWGQGAGGSIFGGRPVDGPVADRPVTAIRQGDVTQPVRMSRQHQHQQQREREQEMMLQGIGSWSATEGADQFEYEPAPIPVEMRVEEASAYPLIRAGQAA